MHKGKGQRRERSVVQADAIIIGAPLPVETKGRAHRLPPLNGLSDLGVQESLHDSRAMRPFVLSDPAPIRELATESANTDEVTQGHTLRHGPENRALADAAHQGDGQKKCTDTAGHVAMLTGEGNALPRSEMERLGGPIERIKARIHARAERRFRIIENRFGLRWVRYRIQSYADL